MSMGTAGPGWVVGGGQGDYNAHSVQEEWNSLQFRDCNGKSNGIDLPLAVLNQESASGGVAGEALGAEKTFDISQVGNGVYGVGGEFILGEVAFENNSFLRFWNFWWFIRVRNF